MQSRWLFKKRADLCATENPRKKGLKYGENVVWDAKNSPWNATRQLFSGFGGGGV